MREAHSLVGRSGELARVSAALGVAEQGGGLVVLSGEAGIGKTRLLAEVAAVAAGAGHLVAVGHCVARAGAAVPYLPFSEVLTGLRAQARTVVDEALVIHPVLAHLIPDAASGSGQPGRVEGPGALAEGVHACLSLLGSRQPTLVVLEDAHWADASSRDLLTVLLTRGFPTPVALAVSYRSDDLHRRHPLAPTLVDWARLPGVTRITLPPLPDDAMGELVRNLAATDDAAIAGVVERAGGNAFFAEELVASGPALGADLARVLRARFEQLDPTAQRVVQAVAVAGGRIGHELLERVVNLPADELDAALLATVDHHTLVAAPPDGYAFRHALVSEAVLDELLPGQRRRLHQSFVAALGEQPALAPASELARHAAASGDQVTAAAAALEAADRALSMGGPREAAGLYQWVLDWVDDDDPRRDDVTVCAAGALVASGDPGRATRLLTDRLELARVGPGRARLLAASVVHARLVEEPSPRRLEQAREALQLTEGRTDHVRLEAQFAHVQALADLGMLAEAAAAGDAALDDAERLGAEDLVIELQTILVSRTDGRVPLAEREADLLARVRESTSGSPARVRAYLRLGLAERSRGNLADSRARFDAAVTDADGIGRTWGVFESLSRLHAGTVRYELGEFADALRVLTPPGPPFPEPFASIFRAARQVVLLARDGAVPEGEREAVARFWAEEPYLLINAIPVELESLVTEGRSAELVTAYQRGIGSIRTLWGPNEEVLIRLSAQFASAAADAAVGGDPALTREQASAVGVAAADARAVATRFQPLGPESEAWLLRLEAEVLRVRWAAGEPVDLDVLEGAWRAALAAFEACGHPYETGRCLARLAGVVAASGGDASALVASVLELAGRLPSATLRRLVAGLGQGVPAQPGEAEALTRRELEVLRLVAQGRSNGQIGRQLFIATKTASVHVSHILAKLGASTRGEAVAIARARELI